MTDSAKATPCDTAACVQGRLETGEGRLGGEHFSRNHDPVTQVLVHRITGQPRRIVAVGISTGDRKQPMTEGLLEAMAHLARLTLIMTQAASRSPNRRRARQF